LLIYPAIRTQGRPRRAVVYACYFISIAYPLGRLDVTTVVLSVSIIAMSLWRPARKTVPEWIAATGAVAMWGVLGIGAILRAANVDIDSRLLLAYQLV